MKIFLIPALLATVLAAHAAPDAALQGRKVLLVVRSDARDHGADEQLRKLLEARGMVVTLADQADPASRAQGQDLVLVSSSANAHVIGARWRKLAVPVLTLQPELLGDLAMTGERADADFGSFEKKDHYLYVVNAAHPLAGGLPAGTFVSTAKNVQMNWGRPSLAATVAVTPPGYFDTPVLFGYEKGASMEQGDTAPARRASFYLPAEAFLKGQPTPATLALFDAALRWSAAGAAQQQPRAAKVPGRKLLLVVQKNPVHPKPEVRAAVDASNQAMAQHFRALGFDVSLADHADAASAADGMDLVVISATVQANVLGGRYKDVQVPVVSFENDVLDDMGMAAKRRGVDFGDVEDQQRVKLVNAPHPMAAGLPAGTLELFQSAVGMGWGAPGRGATTIATLHGAPDKATVFAYEKGATMDHEMLAPARRVYLPVDYNAWQALTPSGLKLVDQALAWAAAAN
jgi:hypothetical protein